MDVRANQQSGGFHRLPISILFLVLSFLLLVNCGGDADEPAEAITDAAATVAHVPEPDPGTWLDGEILPGKGMEDSLLAVDGFGLSQALEVVNGLRDHVDFRYLKAGQPFRIRLSENESTIEEFVFSPDVVTHHRLDRDPETGSFVYRLEEYPTTRRVRLLEGTIRTTLNQALKDRGDASDRVRGVVTGVLECLVSFRTHARSGDYYAVLVEDRMYEGEPVPPSRILYACYEGRRAGFHEAFYYDDGDPSSSWNGHYDLRGRALVHSAMRYPLDRIHVTSTYGRRRHPVTGRYSMHYGVDYRARTGTPVYAVAKGTVIDAGYGKLDGRYVVIRHLDRTRTYYLHLSRISVRRGQKVKAREVIGRAGATGRVNGPHLHFGVRDPRGRWRNPLMQKMIAAPKLDEKRKAVFLKQAADIRDRLNQAIPPYSCLPGSDKPVLIIPPAGPGR